MIIHEIHMDLVNRGTPWRIDAVQGEQGSRSIRAHLYAAGQPWPVPDDVLVSLRYSKPNHKIGAYSTREDGSAAWVADCNTLTMALANELRPFDISVCAVMPGDVKTGFTAAREKNQSGSELYGGIIEKSVSTMEKDEQNGMSPDRIARKVYAMAQKKHPKPLCTVGLSYKLIAFLAKVLPASVINRLIGMIYC